MIPFSRQFPDYFKRAYYKEIVGQYGEFITETINKPIEGKRFDGGLTMEIFDIDDNGYFRGQFQYYESEITLGEVGGRPATERPVHESVSFFYGKLRLKEVYKLAEAREIPVIMLMEREGTFN